MDTAPTEFPAHIPGGEAIPKIMAFEQALMSLGAENHIDLPLNHWFPAGMYARMIFMPAGATLTSRVHKSEHLTVVMSGAAVVTSEDGTTKTIRAPNVFITYPGTKRALYIEEDAIWLTVHRCEARDLEGAADELIADAGTPEEYQAVIAQLMAAIQKPEPKQIEEVAP